MKLYERRRRCFGGDCAVIGCEAARQVPLQRGEDFLISVDGQKHWLPHLRYTFRRGACTSVSSV